MEFLVVVAVGILLFLLVRALMQRQAQRMNERLKDAVTPENARVAAKSLTDEQHKEVYRAIAADDGRQALALFRRATGAKIQDCIIAVQALHAYPQPSPSELHLEDETQESQPRDDEPQGGVHEEYVEDVIDGVSPAEDSAAQTRSSAADAEHTDAEPSHSEHTDAEDAAPDPRDAPAPEDSEAAAPEHTDDEEVDAAARRLMAESGFDHEAELTIPEEWTQQPEDDLGGFHLEVQRGEEKISLSHEDLEPWVHDQLYALLRDDQLEQASELLAAHSPLTREEAHKFLVVFKNQE